MSSKDPLIALEELNEKYILLLNSPEYIKGKRSLKKRTIKESIKRLREYGIEKKVQKKLWAAPKQVYFNPGSPLNECLKGAVYTCITGNYDSIKEPIYLSENVDYICFTDCVDNKDKDSTWIFRRIPESAASYLGASINRYCKMHPFELFPDYDYTIYVDGNVTVVSDISSLYSLAGESKTGIAMHRHSRRDCFYREAKACIMYKRGNVEKIKTLIDEYRDSGFPERFGLLEATIIVTDLRNSNVVDIYNEWWNELLNRETKRDQLSLPYILWRLGYKVEDIGDLGNNEYYNPKFIISSHV